mgnify:CR=1 FL=1
MKKNVIAKEVEATKTVTAESKTAQSLFKVLLVTANKEDKRQFVLELSFFTPEQRREAVMRYHALKGFDSLAKCYGETASARIKLMFYHGTQQREVLSYQLDPKLSPADRIREVKANNRKFVSFLEFYNKLGFVANGIDKETKAVIGTVPTETQKTEKSKRMKTESKKFAKPADEVIDYDKVKIGKSRRNKLNAIARVIAESPVTEPVQNSVEAEPAKEPKKKTARKPRKAKTETAKTEIVTTEPVAAEAEPAKEPKKKTARKPRKAKTETSKVEAILENL